MMEEVLRGEEGIKICTVCGTPASCPGAVVLDTANALTKGKIFFVSFLTPERHVKRISSLLGLKKVIFVPAAREEPLSRLGTLLTSLEGGAIVTDLFLLPHDLLLTILERERRGREAAGLSLPEPLSSPGGYLSLDEVLKIDDIVRRSKASFSSALSSLLSLAEELERKGKPLKIFVKKGKERSEIKALGGNIVIFLNPEDERLLPDGLKEKLKEIPPLPEVRKVERESHPLEEIYEVLLRASEGEKPLILWSIEESLNYLWQISDLVIKTWHRSGAEHVELNLEILKSPSMSYRKLKYSIGLGGLQLEELLTLT